MITPRDIVNHILQAEKMQPITNAVEAFAPINIALCKYWGKRDQVLNLPVTSSLSMALPHIGTVTKLSIIDAAQDKVRLNGELVEPNNTFSQKLSAFLDLFRTKANLHFYVDTYSQVPVAAGLASSASGFAALVKALQQLFQWQIDDNALSILARLGSGSACRSLWSGFVLWQRGEREDGMDSHGIPLTTEWPELKMGLLIFQQKAKPVSSRIAMQRTLETSLLYQSWPAVVDRDLPLLQQAITDKNFNALGSVAECNALAMHATMQAACPPIFYSTPETLQLMQHIWQLRVDGLSVYFTQDAGPNLKLIFLNKDIDMIRSLFKNIVI